MVEPRIQYAKMSDEAHVDVEDRGEHELKGIAEPQRLFAVRAEAPPNETAG